MNHPGGTAWGGWTPERASQAAARRAEQHRAWLARRRLWLEVRAWLPWTALVAVTAWAVLA